MLQVRPPAFSLADAASYSLMWPVDLTCPDPSAEPSCAQARQTVPPNLMLNCRHLEELYSLRLHFLEQIFL